MQYNVQVARDRLLHRCGDGGIIDLDLDRTAVEQAVLGFAVGCSENNRDLRMTL